MQQVHVIDYGIGNIFSVIRALRHIGKEVVHCKTPELLEGAKSVIIPGVGAFGDCINALRNQGFVQPILQHVSQGGFLLGVCVGMQLLADSSNEFGEHQGLGLIPGKVRDISALSTSNEKMKLPHIGWRQLEKNSVSHFDVSGRYYFVHSYTFCCDNPEDRIAYCDYQGVSVTAMIGRGNVYGVQFHPEKSAESGLRLLADVLA